LPAKIETLDAKIAELHAVMSQPDFYKQHSTEIARKRTQLKELSQQQSDAYRRWEELESFAE
jgi:ATP-binding cassette subfamily F protein uup